MAPSKTVYSSKTPLSEEEVALQERRGKYYRKLVRESCETLLEGVDKEKVGIMLSGGVDSTITLWTLLELGVRPYVYTFHMWTAEGISTDAKKAQHLAQKYDLPFRLVEMPKEPDELAKMIKEISDREDELMTRPDFEVMPVFHQIIKEARDRDGVNTMFSGIADGGIHLVGRKSEVKGRYGNFGINEANAKRAFYVGGHQDHALAGVAQALGTNLCLPLAAVATMQPYYNVPWHVMNLPRLKAITINAFLAEETASGIKVQVAPLQNGDSGGRTYYDTMITKSVFAQSFVGRDVTSAQVFYNALRKRHGVENNIYKGWWDWYGHVADGTELPANYPETEIPVDRTGKAVLPLGYEDKAEEEDIFADVIEVEYKRTEDGELDRRVDCLGNRFYEGDDVALTKCPRAQAGLCSSYKPDVRYDVAKCEAWGDWSDSNVGSLKTLAEKSAGEVREAYLKLADRAETVLADITSDRHTFS